MLLFYHLNLFLFLINLFLAVLGLRCYARAFSSWGKWWLLLVALRGPLITVASLVEHGLQLVDFGSCDAPA